MKSLTNLMLALMAMLSVNGQLLKLKEKETSNPAFSKAVETILGDFPYNYRHIAGDLVRADGDFRQYASTVALPGSEYCTIASYGSALDTTASWQALMFRHESFENAAREYRRLYQQLRHCRLKVVDGSVYYLDGEYEEATEALDFVTTRLTVQTADDRFRRFYVELELLYKMDEWIVNINMVTKKKDSDERPDWWEGR